MKKSVIIFGLTIFASSCGAPTTPNPSPSSKSKVDSLTGATGAAVAPVNKWRCNEDGDKMSGTKTRTCMNSAEKKLEFDFPYNGGSVATFFVRKKDGDTDTFLSVSKGQFMDTSSGGSCRIKFDDKQPKKYSYSGAADYSSDIIFFNNSKALIAELKKAKTMLIEATFYNEGSRTIEFDVSGFEWN